MKKSCGCDSATGKARQKKFPGCPELLRAL
jgi:hypothetical protein